MTGEGEISRLTTDGNNHFSSRSCRLLCSREEKVCLPCQDLMSSLTVKHDDKYHSRRGDLSGSFDKFEDEKDKEVEVEEEDKACNLSNDQEKKGIKFSCPQCSNTFQSQLKMVRHAIKKHGSLSRCL